MVLLSSLAQSLGYYGWGATDLSGPALFAFGSRTMTHFVRLQEMILLWPVLFVVGWLTSHAVWRLIMSCKPPMLRGDLWAGLLITVAGDGLLELLLPSVRCYPPEPHYMLGAEKDDWDMDWEDRFWSYDEDHWDVWYFTRLYTGRDCATGFEKYSDSLWTPEATGFLLVGRVLALVVGLAIGEAYMPIVLTGSIATGKSTVLNLLVGYDDEEEEKEETTRETDGEKKDDDAKEEKKNEAAEPVDDKKSGAASWISWILGEADESYYASAFFDLIETDKIGHEILLPPAKLQEMWDKQKDGDSDSQEAALTFLVRPKDSVYDKICKAFKGHDIFQEAKKEEKNKEKDTPEEKKKDESAADTEEEAKAETTTIPPLIDRPKLGAIIFKDAKLRRKLNSLTHSKIRSIMFGRMFTSLYWIRRFDFVLVELPLLLEHTSWIVRCLMFPVVIVVHVADTQMQQKRLMERNPDLTKSQAMDRIKSQMPSSRKANRWLYYVVPNNGNREDLKAQVFALKKDLIERMYGFGLGLTSLVAVVAGTLGGAVAYQVWQARRAAAGEELEPEL